MSGFTGLADVDLLELLARQGEACARIMAMPELERRAPGRKGEASPEQAGLLHAVFAVHAEREAVRRGLLPVRTLT